MGNVYSGRLSAIDNVSFMRDWNVSVQASNPKVIDSATQGGTLRRGGPKSWNGSVNGSGGRPSKFIGDSFSFIGYLQPADGISGVGPRLSGTVFIDQLVINWNFQTQDIINHSLTFQGSGALTRTASAAQILDAGVPDYPEMQGLQILRTIGVAAEEAWPNVISASLTFSNPSVQYVDADTGGWTYRKKGPGLDFTASVTTHEVMETSPEIGDEMVLKFPVGDDEFWEVAWAKVTSFTNINVNRQTGEVISRTVNLEGTMFNEAGTAGHVHSPGAVVLWP